MRTGIFNRFGLEITTPRELKSKLAYEIRKAKLEEQERIIKLLDDSSRICGCKETCITDVNIVAFLIEELGINVIDLIRGGDGKIK